MIKVLLVDDEAIARINLICLIDWEKEGYYICGEADNGYDALKKVDQLNPEIIFTDMNMAGMTGIEFIKSARKISPTVRIIAFSAFDDFEFVRQSLKEGAVDYLVKHKIDAKSLLNILNTEKENIKNEFIETQRINKIAAIASSGKIFIQKNVLKNLLNGYVKENFEAIMREYDICLDSKNLIVAVGRIDSFYQIKEKFTSHELAVFLQSMENILSNLCSDLGKTEFIYLEDGKFALVMSFADTASEGQINSRSISNICKVEETVKKFLNLTMSFGVSSICPSFTKLGDYYIEACTILENAYYKGSSYIAKKNELVNDEYSNNQAGLSVWEEKNIILCIRGLKRDSVIIAIEDIFKGLKAKKSSFDSVKIVSIELINILKRMIKEFSIPLELLYTNSSGLYEEINRYRTLEELLLWFKELYGKLMEIFEENKINDSFSPVIKKSIDYILKNYNKDISLSDVSEAVDVSPQYLSKLFKEECGKGFVNYLSKVRIEQAKRMMSEGLDLKILAQKVGFNNYTYFFTVFKETTGMTPQQYEKTLVSKEK